MSHSDIRGLLGRSRAEPHDCAPSRGSALLRRESAGHRPAVAKARRASLEPYLTSFVAVSVQRCPGVCAVRFRDEVYVRRLTTSGIGRVLHKSTGHWAAGFGPSSGLWSLCKTRPPKAFFRRGSMATIIVQAGLSFRSVNTFKRMPVARLFAPRSVHRRPVGAACPRGTSPRRIRPARGQRPKLPCCAACR